MIPMHAVHIELARSSVAAEKISFDSRKRKQRFHGRPRRLEINMVNAKIIGNLPDILKGGR